MGFEEDVAQAWGALRGGDGRHAAHHVAGAVSVRPHDPAVVELVDALFHAQRDPLALLPDDDSWVGTAALRAALLAKLDRPAEAAELALHVMIVQPTLDLAAWVAEWTALPAVHAAPDLSELLATAYECTGRPEVAARVDAAFRALSDARPRDDRAVLVAAKLARVAGRVHDAVAIARAGHARLGTKATATALASSLREAGDPDGAVAAFRELLRLDPRNVGAWLDIGDISLDTDRAAAAVAAYDEALAIEPGNAWATASVAYARFHSTGDLRHRDALVAFAAAHPDDLRAARLVPAAFPYERHLPGRIEAVVASARAMVDRNLSGNARVVVSSLEAPSAVHAAARVARARGGTLSFEFSDVPTPDPRVAAVPWVDALWVYEHTTAIARPRAPPPEVAWAVAAIARAPFVRDAWLDLAADATEGRSEALARDLLAVCVHPPAVEDGFTEWDWTFRVQLAVALMLSTFPAPFEGSPQRGALCAMLLGPLDWTTEAGLVGLAEIASRDDAARDELVGAVRLLASRRSGPIWHMTFRSPLLALAPLLPPELAADVAALRDGR